MQHVQPQLGGSAHEVVHVALKWSIERGWEGRITGRRSGTEAWDQVAVGGITAEAMADELVEALASYGVTYRDDFA